MTVRRSRAYGRIVRGLRTSAALEQITAEQRERLRDAADTLVLADSWDETTRIALATAHAVLLRARTLDREPWIQQLAADLEDAGPAPPDQPLRAGDRPLDNLASGPDHPARR
jgi:hypothetical protein